MGSTSSFCQQAIAYLKPAVRGEEPVLSLSNADSPVLRSVNDDLLVTYVVDAGQQFRFVQHRDLVQEGMSTDELHGIAVSNLEHLAEEKLTVREYGSIYVALTGGNFEASHPDGSCHVDALVCSPGARHFRGGRAGARCSCVL